MSNADEKMMEQVFSDARAAVGSHAQVRRVVRNVARCADGSISAEEAGCLLLKSLGSEQAVKEWVEHHTNQINRALTLWYMAARIEAHETKGSKK